MKELQVSKLEKLAHFSGVAHLLLIGEGEVQLMKSVDGKDDDSYYALTDASGEIVEFSGSTPDDVLFNAELENDCHRVHYALLCTSGKINYQVAK
jgi:hypothetical protein